ncbi:MlaD family protein (plasmid) [Paracoccus sp. TK19116]|uniref:MlaD family protein n=1 Tax=Paracoccus albicereus TaxID=2922394 RepID=A0ABT1MM27_9RHOB|nr:MlaD family protein [Paracoccus albicereus]MCQ0969342.1 MlaD family protein [Paracoccus albicereus]
MSDNPNTPLRPTSPARKTARRAAEAGVSLIWAVPIIALVVTLFVAWNNFADRGSLIHVVFTDAAGITPGETALKFREINVGSVESVEFTEDLRSVVVDIRVDPDVARFIDADAQFWLVRPEVTARGVTRLDTVLTGAFIEGAWDDSPGNEQTTFTGLDRPPLFRGDQQGTWVTISTENAEGLSEGAPVLYRGLQVGRMENLRIAENEETVLFDAFVEAPHDDRLSTATVFWDTSGVSVSLGTSGVSVAVNSIASLLQGGVEFETMTSGGQPLSENHIFRLQPDAETAQNYVFAGDEGNEARFTLLIDDTVSGLERGADVDLEGLTVGRVSELQVVFAESDDEPRVQQRVTIALSPTRMGLPRGAAIDDVTNYIADAVERGVRARVASSGLLGTSLIVELVEIPDAEPATLDLTSDPNPVIPTVPSDLSDFSDTAQGLLTRVGNLPIEELLQSATDMMNSVTALASSQDTRAIPGGVRATIDDAQATMTEIRTMVEEIRETGAAGNAGEALAQASEMAGKLNTAADRLPGILESLETASTSVRDVDFASIGAELDAAIQDVRDVIGTEAAAALPAKISTLLDTLDSAAGRIDAVTAELQEAGTVASFATLIDDASVAVQDLRVAAADVPEMVQRIDDAATSVDEFEFSEISAQAEGILTDLRAMLGTEDAEQLPRNLSNTLEAASGLLNDLRDGNAAGSLNGALDSARVAADEVAVAVRELPALVQRLQQTAARAEAVLAAYGDRSAFNSEAVNMLRELRRATGAFGSLARTIERNPRAFILGR